MSDRTLRRAQRQFAIDPRTEAKLFIERMRAGTLKRTALELAAYCGDLAALEAVGDQLCANDGMCGHGKEDGTCSRNTRGWLYGLYRWGAECQVQATVVAAKVARDSLLRDGLRYVGTYRLGDLEPIDEAINAAGAWLTHQDEKHYRGWVNAWNALGNAKGWIPAPGRGVRSTQNVVSLVNECASILCDSRTEDSLATLDTCSQMIRVVIRTALIKWVLA